MGFLIGPTHAPVSGSDTCAEDQGFPVHRAFGPGMGAPRRLMSKANAPPTAETDRGQDSRMLNWAGSSHRVLAQILRRKAQMQGGQEAYPGLK